MSASNQQVPGTMFTFTPPWMTPMFRVTRWTMSFAPGSWRLVEGGGGPRQRIGYLDGHGRPQGRQLFEVDDEARGLLGGARGEMRVGAVRARRAQRELDPERAFFPEADGERAARL